MKQLDNGYQVDVVVILIVHTALPVQHNGNVFWKADVRLVLKKPSKHQ